MYSFRCWANETAVLLDTKVSNDIPFNEYFEHYGPLYQLHNPMQSKIHNQNTSQYLNQVRETAMEHLRHLECAPSVQMHQVPADFFVEDIEAFFRKERAMERGVPFLSNVFHVSQKRAVSSILLQVIEDEESSSPVHGAELYDNEKDVDRMDVDDEKNFSGPEDGGQGDVVVDDNDGIDFDD
jgi:hypothetical protein